MMKYLNYYIYNNEIFKTSYNETENLSDLPTIVLINVILVKEKIRPAMMVQPADYNEATKKDKKTKNILKIIKKYYPELYQSEDQEGIIISYTNYENKKYNIGEILGYPCYKEFNEIKQTDTSYGISVDAYIENGKKVQVIGNKCKNKDKLKLFEDFAKKVKNTLDKEENKQILGNNKITDVKVDIQAFIPVTNIINKLINNDKLDEDDKATIENEVGNIVTYVDGEMPKMFKFVEYDNPIHRGLLLSLLIKTRYDTLDPFYPLQRYPHQKIRVEEISEQWENEYENIFKKTKIH